MKAGSIASHINWNKISEQIADNLEPSSFCFGMKTFATEIFVNKGHNFRNNIDTLKEIMVYDKTKDIESCLILLNGNIIVVFDIFIQWMMSNNDK